MTALPCLRNSGRRIEMCHQNDKCGTRFVIGNGFGFGGPNAPDDWPAARGSEGPRNRGAREGRPAVVSYSYLSTSDRQQYSVHILET